jgi:hypothetical protein
VISNCRIRAWKRFVDGEAEWIAFRMTRYAALKHHAERWYWQPLKPFGIVLMWLGISIVETAWFLRWGSWYHMVWILPGGEWWEYVPIAPHRSRVIPPYIFKGKEQRLK